MLENEKRTYILRGMTVRHPPLPALSALAPRRGVLTVIEGMELARGRVHEFCGPARRTLAALAIGGEGRAGAPAVMWVLPAWSAERPNPEGLARFCEPGRLLLVQPSRGEDLLWVVEEVLRSGAVGLVVAELPEPPGLTPVRRLHLAAEAGAAQGRVAPLGVLLTPADGGGRGVETRWHLAPAHGPQDCDEAWILERRRARTAPPARWRMRARGEGFCLEPLAGTGAAAARLPGGAG